MDFLKSLLEDKSNQDEIEKPENIEELLVADWRTVVWCSKNSEDIRSLCDNKFWQMRRDLLNKNQNDSPVSESENHFQAYLRDLLSSLKNELHQAHISEVRRIESEINEVKETLQVLPQQT